MIKFFKTTSGSIIAVGLTNELSGEQFDALCWLFGNAGMVNSEEIGGCFVGPRREMITPWSTNAVEITQNMGIQGVARIEEYFPVSGTDAKYDYMLQRLSLLSILRISKSIMSRRAWRFRRRR